MGNALRAQTPDDFAGSGLIDELVLARVAAARGATRSELLRDLGNLTSHKLSPSELRTHVDAALAKLVADQNATVSRGRYHLTDTGVASATPALGCKTLPGEWSDIRDVRLIALALGLADQSEQRIKSLARPDGLRAAILQQAYSLPGRRAPSPARLRNALAVVALERAFGNKIKSGLGSGKGLSARAGRMLAGQLARRPRDFGTDTRLISALAAEASGAMQPDAASLRTAILRNAFARKAGPDLALVAPEAEAEAEHVEATASRSEQKPQASTRPDLPGFAKIVQAAAKRHGDGWPGNQKAYISHVWSAVEADHPEWGLTEIEFKAMLAEAHRTGHVVLANADLKSKSNVKDVQDSAVAYKNTVWHYVRVEE